MHNFLKDNTHFAIVRTLSGVELRKVKTPEVGPGELLVAPIVAGLCGTDIQILKGERNEIASIIGHEGVVEIVKAGSGCPRDFVPGKRFLINPTDPSDAQFLLGHNVDGLFQEYLHIPASAVSAGLVMELPETFPLALAPLIEPLAAVIYAFELLRPQCRGGSMIIYGDGIIGHLSLLLVRKYHGSSIPCILVHHSQEGLKWSCRQQFKADVNLLFNELVSENKNKLAHIPPPGSALLATPRSATLSCLNHAVNFLAPFGCIDILGGLPQDAYLASLPTIDLVKLRAANCGGLPKQPVYVKALIDQRKPLILCGHRGVANEHLKMAMSELASNATTYQKLISHYLNIEQAADFMNNLSKNGSRSIDGKRVLKLGVVIKNSKKTMDSEYFQ